ncbi:XdhC family protein [Piscinibacter sakaiensis]|uniref:Xanthine and CO dehydrogenases maturation factor, XdhC/CoxF family n=1 Tax=Piscinibacter sakaiensis TaxID=1547922 RepID=A0A0K8P2U4_PISS1|nr:XdhC family protein [Piscinibacter sakaiensis]GAP36933.1 xanthine and CO dehydrogenases maturation factor, XdhC/CoxF family [Piscinibacter sakaiensis]
MDSLDLQVLAQAREWHAAGHAVWLVTVLETWGSAPRPPGALLALRGDGLVVGSVSGGCVEDDLIDRVRHGERVGRPSLIHYGVSKEEAARFGLPCGGNLRLVQEPLAGTGWIDEVLARTGRHELVARVLDLETGEVRIEPAARSEQFSFDGRLLRALFGPRWRMLIIGAGQLSRVLAQMALALDFEVICCDPREEYHLTWEVPGTAFSRQMPDDLVLELQLDPHSAVVAVTHDPKLDDLALLEALKSPAFYIGALGSRGNTAARKERLRQFDLSPAEIDRLHGPIGLHIGSRTPAEIAVSILAEVVAVKNGVGLTQKKDGSAVPAPADGAVCAAGLR